MSFLNPILLWAGLACVALPIIVHLLTRRRRKPVEWGAMRFLLEAYRKHKRRLTLEQFLLLAARCALVALVALALGKPILGSLARATGPGPRTVVIAIDNGLTAGLQGTDGTTALSRSVSKARELLDSLDQARGDRAGLVALGAPAQAVVLPPSSDIAGVKRQLEALEATDSRTDLAAGAAAVRTEMFEGAAPEAAPGLVLALIGEWRSGSADVERRLPLLSPQSVGAERPLVLASRPANDSVDNVAVIGLEPMRSVLIADANGAVPAESGQVRVLLRRSGPGVSRAGSSIVSVVVDRADRPTPGLVPTQATATWAAGERETSVLLSVGVPALEAGARPVMVATIDRDAVAGDNTFRRPIELRRALQIGVVSTPAGVGNFGPGEWLKLALKPDAEAFAGRAATALRVVDIDPRTIASAGQLTGVDALFITSPEKLDRAAWERCATFCWSGGLVFVAASREPGAQLWTDDFVQTFGLGWRIAREPVQFNPPASLADPATAPARPVPDLLAMLSGEMTELVRPVGVSRALALEGPAEPAATVLSLADGTALLSVARPAREPSDEPTQSHGRGLVVFLGVAPDVSWTDLPTKPLMLPLVQELVRQGVGAARPPWTGTAGHALRAPIGAVELRSLSRGGAPVLSTPAALAGGVRRADVWAATDARGSTLELIAVNPDTAASDTTVRSEEDLSAWISGLAGEDRFAWLEDGTSGPEAGRPQSAALPDRDHAPPISPDLLLAALVVALAEMAMARWFSHATVATGAPAPGGGV